MIRLNNRVRPTDAWMTAGGDATMRCHAAAERLCKMQRIQMAD